MQTSIATHHTSYGQFFLSYRSWCDQGHVDRRYFGVQRYLRLSTSLNSLLFSGFNGNVVKQHGAPFIIARFFLFLVVLGSSSHRAAVEWCYSALMQMTQNLFFHSKA